jgi:hypothetical protein
VSTELSFIDDEGEQVQEGETKESNSAKQWHEKWKFFMFSVALHGCAICPCVHMCKG